MPEDPEENKDSLDYTPRMGLEQALKALEPGGHLNFPEEGGEPTKMFAIFLWDEPDGNYHTSFANTGMKTSEVIALLEVMKARMMMTIAPYHEEED